MLHPSKPWKDKYVNNYDKAQATDHGVIGREEKLIRRRLIDCVLVSHANFPGQVFHVALQKVVVVDEGPESELFETIMMAEMEMVRVMAQTSLLAPVQPWEWSAALRKSVK